ncbi:MAG TPA: transglycosylase SLT domain-containing protein [Polyangiaceae bacterium]|jgi:membrane-bound lytic murein transglycosylase D
MNNRSNYSVAALAGLIIGGISAQGGPPTLLAALIPFWPHQDLQSPTAKAAPSAATDAPQRFQSPHLGAESPELRALRRAEAGLFPELGPLDMSAPAAAPVACTTPEADSWQVSQSLPDEAHPGWPSGLKLPAIPVQRNARVAKYIRYFSNSGEGRKLFTTWLRRSGRYRNVVTRALEQRDLPRDLLALVFVESGFWPTAVSSAGATGLWQFMPETARAYGLKVERDYDERQSIFPATAAAADHLADLHARFQSWDLALAAYNMGYKGLSERIDQYQTDDFWALSQIPNALPRETALYVPKVQAVAVLLNNLEYFGFGDVELAPPMDAAEIEIPSGVRLSLLARAAGTSVRRLRELNPQIRGDILPDRGEPLTVYVPGNGVSRARSMLPTLLSRQDSSELDRQVSPDFDWGHDDVGEQGLSRLERTNSRVRHQQPFWETMRDSSESGEPGPERARSPRDDEPRGSSSWRVRNEDSEPGSSERPRSANEPDGAREDLPRIDKPVNPLHRLVLYRVARGDTLSHLVEEFNISRRQVLLDNRIRNPSHILRGQLLKLRVPPAPKTSSEMVSSGSAPEEPGANTAKGRSDAPNGAGASDANSPPSPGARTPPS